MLVDHRTCTMHQHSFQVFQNTFYHVPPCGLECCLVSLVLSYTEDDRTQGIMEKSQWDLKRILFERRRLTRLDDFVRIYQRTHDAFLQEYADVGEKKERSFTEWRLRSGRKKVESKKDSTLLL